MYPTRDASYNEEYITYLLNNYSSMLIRLCYSYTNNTYDAEDIAQDTFVEVIKHKPVFTNAEHEKAWLITTARNKCKNLLKSARVKKNVPIEEDIPEVSFENTTDDRMSVINAVMQLKESYREVIHMYYYMDMKISDIASVLHIPIATVGTRLNRAKKILKQTLGDDFLE